MGYVTAPASAEPLPLLTAHWPTGEGKTPSVSPWGAWITPGWVQAPMGQGSVGAEQRSQRQGPLIAGSNLVSHILLSNFSKFSCFFYTFFRGNVSCLPLPPPKVCVIPSCSLIWLLVVLLFSTICPGKAPLRQPGVLHSRVLYSHFQATPDYFAKRTEREFPSSTHTIYRKYHQMQSFTSKTPYETSSTNFLSLILMKVTVLPLFPSTERLYQNPTIFTLKTFVLTFSVNVFIVSQKILLLG